VSSLIYGFIAGFDKWLDYPEVDRGGGIATNNAISRKASVNLLISNGIIMKRNMIRNSTDAMMAVILTITRFVVNGLMAMLITA
jgi:hypothetical protein